MCLNYVKRSGEEVLMFCYTLTEGIFSLARSLFSININREVVLVVYLSICPSVQSVSVQTNLSVSMLSSGNLAHILLMAARS